MDAHKHKQIFSVHVNRSIYLYRETYTHTYNFPIRSLHWTLLSWIKWIEPKHTLYIHWVHNNIRCVSRIRGSKDRKRRQPKCLIFYVLCLFNNVMLIFFSLYSLYSIQFDSIQIRFQSDWQYLYTTSEATVAAAFCSNWLL